MHKYNYLLFFDHPKEDGVNQITYKDVVKHIRKIELQLEVFMSKGKRDTQEFKIEAVNQITNTNLFFNIYSPAFNKVSEVTLTLQH